MKSFTDALVRRLNAICEEIQPCINTCASIGWCEECWDGALEKCYNMEAAYPLSCSEAPLEHPDSRGRLLEES